MGQSFRVRASPLHSPFAIFPFPPFLLSPFPFLFFPFPPATLLSAFPFPVVLHARPPVPGAKGRLSARKYRLLRNDAGAISASPCTGAAGGSFVGSCGTIRVPSTGTASGRSALVSVAVLPGLAFPIVSPVQRGHKAVSLRSTSKGDSSPIF